MGDGSVNTEGNLKLDVTKNSEAAAAPTVPDELEQTLGQAGSNAAVEKISALDESIGPKDLPAFYEQMEKEESEKIAANKAAEATENQQAKPPEAETPLDQDQQDRNKITEAQRKIDAGIPLDDDEGEAYLEAYNRQKGKKKTEERQAFDAHREKIIAELKEEVKNNPTKENLDRLKILQGDVEMKSVEGVNIRMDMLYQKVKENGDITDSDIVELKVLQNENEDAFIENMTKRSMGLLIEELFNPKNVEGNIELKVTKEVTEQLQELLKVAYSREQLEAASIKLNQMAKTALQEAKDAEQELNDAPNPEEKRKKTLEFVKKAQRLNGIYDRMVKVQIQYDTIAENFDIAFARVRHRLNMANGFTTFWRILGASATAYYKKEAHNIKSYLAGTAAYHHLNEATAGA